MSAEERCLVLAGVAVAASLLALLAVRRGKMVSSFGSRFEASFREEFYHLTHEEQDRILCSTSESIRYCHAYLKNGWWQLSQVAVEMLTRAIHEELGALRVGYPASFHEERLLAALRAAWPRQFPWENTVRQIFESPIAA